MVASQAVAVSLALVEAVDSPVEEAVPVVVVAVEDANRFDDWTISQLDI